MDCTSNSDHIPDKLSALLSESPNLRKEWCSLLNRINRFCPNNLRSDTVEEAQVSLTDSSHTGSDQDLAKLLEILSTAQVTLSGFHHLQAVLRSLSADDLLSDTCKHADKTGSINQFKKMAGNFNYFAVNQMQQQNAAGLVQQAMSKRNPASAATPAQLQYLPVATTTAAGSGATHPQYYNGPNIQWLLQSQQQLPLAQQPLVQPQVAVVQPNDDEEEERLVFRCPDCHKSFKHASGVFIHASQLHYASNLQNTFWPEVELTSTCPICSKPIDKAKYLAHIGAKHKKIILFMTPEKREQYMNIEKQKLSLGRRKRKGAGNSATSTVREDKFRCPDCDKPFAFVAPLYIHAATTHYNEQIKAKYLPVYKEHGKCHLCGSLVSQTSIVSHFGGKHRRILTFMDEEKRQQYMSMKKRSWTNFRETGGLTCAYPDCIRAFKNLTMYKQHLANTHVRNELLNQARLIKDARCNFCGKVMPKQYSLLQHLGTCHNQIIHYVPLQVKQHLTQLGVTDPNE